MSSDKSLHIIVFDVNETLLDITTLEPLFARLFGKKILLREWFAQLVLYSQRNIKPIRLYYGATGTNFTCLLYSQRLRKFYPSSTVAI